MKNIPRIYIIVKQLSKAIPTRKRQTQKCQKLVQNAVAMPPTKPTKFVPTRAGILPIRSAIQPKINPPKIAPQKKMDWAVCGRAEFSQTQFCYKIIHPSGEIINAFFVLLLLFTSVAIEEYGTSDILYSQP